MAKPDDNAAKLKDLEAKFAALENELNNVKAAAAGGNDEQVPEFDRNARGNLTRRGRAQQKKWVREQRKEAREEIRQEKRERLAGRQAKAEEKSNESAIDKFAEEGAQQADLGSVDTSGAEAAFNEKFLNAKSSVVNDFSQDITVPNIIVPESSPSTDFAANQEKSEKPPQVPGQPGYINVKAENEDGECKIFKVIGHEEADCDGGTYEDNATVAMTNWWQPTFSLPGDTGYDQPKVTIGEGLNLIPAPADSSKLQPIQYWKREYFTPGEQNLETGGTTYFWIKQTFYTKYYLVSDKIVYSPSESAGSFIASPLGATDAQFGDIKQKYWYSGVGKGTLTGNFAIVRKTSATQDDDDDTDKQQFLGQGTLDGDNAITSWNWRLNHAFNWQFPIYSVGTYGYTTAAGSGSGTTPPTYDAPTID